jgi:hypothetical protein
VLPCAQVLVLQTAWNFASWADQSGGVAWAYNFLVGKRILVE